MEHISALWSLIVNFTATHTDVGQAAAQTACARCQVGL